MKSCPTCMRVFPDDAGFCPADGSALQFASMVPVAANQNDARVGSKLCDRYEIRRVVADGGMGRVYEGIDKQTQTRIAVKVLHDEVSKDDVSLARFTREYEISRLLPHEHIVKVLDFQRDATGVWLLVMEFLDGEELRFVLKRDKNIAPERLVRMLAQVAIGLDEAHARQLVHRDLKPDNLFLCGSREGDTVKILDFGSVKDKNKDAKKLTVLGTTIGSPYYMAPEQAQGLDTLDARADVFALAAITYECVTGTVPFTGSNGPSILLNILTKDPDPPSSKSAGAKYPIPLALDDVMELSLAKNPNIRTKSVGALATAVGHAYGLAGDHLQWARMPQPELARLIAEAAARMPAAPRTAPAALEASADPFAAPPAAQPAPPAYGQQQVSQPQHGSVPHQQAAPPAHAAPMAQHMAPPPAQMTPPQAYASGGTSGGYTTDPVGIPGINSGRPAWLIPLVVGLVALLVGGGIAIALAR